MKNAMTSKASVTGKTAATKLTLAVKGVHCAGCVATVEKNLKAQPGVADAVVNLTSERVLGAAPIIVLAISLAVLGLLHPVIAEITMATSSITVVGNANLLRRTQVKFAIK